MCMRVNMRINHAYQRTLLARLLACVCTRVLYDVCMGVRFLYTYQPLTWLSHDLIKRRLKTAHVFSAVLHANYQVRAPIQAKEENQTIAMQPPLAW